MKKKLLVWLLTVSMIFEAGGTLVYAKETGTEPQAPLELEITNTEPTRKIELEQDIEMEMQTDDSEQTVKAEESTEGTEQTTDPDNQTEETKQTTDTDNQTEETKQTTDTDNQTEETKQTTDTDGQNGEFSIPAEAGGQTESPQSLNPVGSDEYFNEFDDDLWDYRLGTNKNSFLFSETDYFLFEMKEEKNVQFDIQFELSEYGFPEDGNPIINVHKVTKTYDEYDEIDYYHCTSCIIQQQGVFNPAGYYSFSTIKTLQPSWYIIEISPSTEEVAFDYKFKTTDVTSYATSLTLPFSLYLKAGEKKSLPVSNILPQGAVSGITWSTDKPSVAKVNANGTVTGVSYGTCNIKATLKNNRTYTCKIYVENPSLTSKLNILKGQSKTLKVKNVYQKVSWKSSNPAIASVNAANGTVTANKVGTATITATVAGKNLKCKVTVEQPKLNLTSKQLVVGDTYQLKMLNTTQKVSWKSDNKSKAIVSSKGLVTAKKPGKVTISGTVAGKRFSCKFNIKDTKLKTTSIKMATGTTKILEWRSKVKKIKWSSENKKIATVNSKGGITAKKAGSTKIIAKVGTVKYICVVTCESPRLSKKSLSIERKKSTTLKVTGTTMKVNWKTTDSSIASVSSKGKIVGKKAGKVTITARVGGKDLKCKVTVKALQPSYSVTMSGKTDYNAGAAAMLVTNTGKGTMRIYSNGAKFIDNDYVHLDRTMRMVDINNLVFIDHIDIAPGKSVYVGFLLDGDYSIYDYKTTYQYDFSYDGVNYQGRSSYYYGSFYTKK